MSSPLVSTRSGLLRGLPAEGGCASFLGIPYAQPPTGDEGRWRPTRTPEAPWSTGAGGAAVAVRNATEYAPICPQPRGSGWSTLDMSRMSESCLFLNVAAPWPLNDDDNSRLLPVLVFIHGGDYMAGGANDREIHGCTMVRAAGKDVVVVTIQYRLGVFGFLGGTQLGGKGGRGGGAEGNFGLLDAVAALEWVRDNAREFGGDPGKVTIFGESAGAGMVSALLVAPRARGLFHRAAMQSGGFAEWVAKTEADGQAIADELFSTHDRDGDLGTLLAMSAEEVVAAAEKLDAYPDAWTVSRWAPTVDGTVLPVHPLEAATAGAGAAGGGAAGGGAAAGASGVADPPVAPVPLMFGNNDDEGSLFVSVDASMKGPGGGALSKDLTPDDLVAWARRNFGASRTALLDEAYRLRDCTDQCWRNRTAAGTGGGGSGGSGGSGASSTGTGVGGAATPWEVAQTMVGDLMFFCPMRKAMTGLLAGAETSAATGASGGASTPTPTTRRRPPIIFEYLFDAEPGAWGACHGCEIPFVFGGKIPPDALPGSNTNTTSSSSGSGSSGTTAAHYEADLSLAMVHAWTNFAWTGDPSDPGTARLQRSRPRSALPLPQGGSWPRVPPQPAGAAAYPYVEFDTVAGEGAAKGITLGTNLRVPECAAWNAALPPPGGGSGGGGGLSDGGDGGDGHDDLGATIGLAVGALLGVLVAIFATLLVLRRFGCMAGVARRGRGAKAPFVRFEGSEMAPLGGGTGGGGGGGGGGDVD
eukprot:g1889.t1